MVGDGEIVMVLIHAWCPCGICLLAADVIVCGIEDQNRQRPRIAFRVEVRHQRMLNAGKRRRILREYLSVGCPKLQNQTDQKDFQVLNQKVQSRAKAAAC